MSARVVDGVLRVSVPDTLSAAEEQRHVEDLRRRLERQRSTSTVDLSARAGRLARRLGLPSPESIRWVDNQRWRWGSCTPADRTVRISSQLADEPAWVLDYVIVHELAHLDVPGHSAAFWELVGAYPLAERARGFLMARAHREPGAGCDARFDEPWCDPPAIPLGPGGDDLGSRPVP